MLIHSCAAVRWGVIVYDNENFKGNKLLRRTYLTWNIEDEGWTRETPDFQYSGNFVEVNPTFVMSVTISWMCTLDANFEIRNSFDMRSCCVKSAKCMKTTSFHWCHICIFLPWKNNQKVHFEEKKGNYLLTPNPVSWDVISGAIYIQVTTSSAHKRFSYIFFPPR